MILDLILLVVVVVVHVQHNNIVVAVVDMGELDNYYNDLQGLAVVDVRHLTLFD